MATQTAVLDDVGSAAGSIRDPEAASQTVTRVEVRLLGGFEVRIDGRSVAPDRWSRRHSDALVQLLALAPGRSLHREKVIGALWPDLGIDLAAPRLHKAAHYARKALGHRAAVVLSGETVRLCPHADVSVDAVQFQRLAEAALDTGGIAAAKGALAAFGGELLPHDPYEPWAEQPRLHLGRLYVELLHQAEDWHQALVVDPSDEPAHLALAHRYAERGDRPAALRQLDHLESVMREELGLEPSEQALHLREHVLAFGRRPSLSGESKAVDPGQPAGTDQCCEQTSAAASGPRTRPTTRLHPEGRQP